MSTLDVGSTPDQTLLLRPKWLIFSPQENYLSPQYCQFTITNSEEKSVAFRLRTRDRNFPQVSHCHGFLEPLQSIEVTVVIPSVEHWPRDLHEYTGRRHKIVVENLVLPEDVEKPLDRRERNILCRKIFRNTASRLPATRCYLKLNVVLPRVANDEGSTSQSC
ncbi:MSP domain-containing protein [Aphelenchoides bicaudatus]|nr:MSP domain-containing protein [Aphelenchoides bicaudatus]